MEERIETLQDLTGQESGVVIYDNEAIICNWSSINGMPRLFADGLVGLAEEIESVDPKNLSADELVDLLDPVSIIYDANDDESGLRNGDYAGKVYILPDAIVIAPEGWN